MAIENGGSMAVSPQSHASDFSWRAEAFDALNFNEQFGNGVSKEELFDLVVDAGAEDLTFSEEIVEVFASVESFKSVSDALQVANIAPDEAMLRMEPKNMVELPPSETAQVMKTIESVEELDDVQNVYTNLEVTTDALTLYAGD